MSKVNVTELRQNLPAYLARVKDGEPVEVSVRGRVVGSFRRATASKAARERLKAARRKARVGDVISPTGRAGTPNVVVVDTMY